MIWVNNYMEEKQGMRDGEWGLIYPSLKHPEPGPLDWHGGCFAYQWVTASLANVNQPGLQLFLPLPSLEVADSTRSPNPLIIP